MLNELSDKITAVEGNCDSYTETEEAKFMMRDINYDYAFDKFIVLSHGHLYSPFNYTSGYDIFIYGHTHIHQLYQGKDGKIILNPGSLSCPRDGIHSVATIDSEGIKIIDFNTEYVIEKLKF